MSHFYICSYGAINCRHCRPLRVEGEAPQDVYSWSDPSGYKHDFWKLARRSALSVFEVLVRVYGRDAISVVEDPDEAGNVDSPWSKDGTLDRVRGWEAARRVAAEDVMSAAAAEREAAEAERALRVPHHPPRRAPEPETVLLDEMLGVL